MLADGTKREDVIGLRRRIWRLQEELHLRDGVDHIVVDLCSDLMRSYGAEDAQAQARNEGLHLAFCKDSPTGYECVEVSSGSTDVRHIAVARFANEFDCMDDPPTRICAFQSAHVAAICAARARREWESMIENAGYQAANIITRERNRGEQCAVRADEDGNQPQQQTMVAAEKSDESPSSQDGLRRAATMSPVTQITQRSSGSKRCGSCGGCDLFKMSGCGHCVNCKGKEAGGMQKWGCLRALCHGSNAYAKSQNAKCRAMERQTSLSDVGLLDPNDYVVQVGQKLQCFSYLDHKTKWWTCELRSYSVTDGVYTLVDLASGSELRVEPADVLFASLSHAPLPSPRHKWSSRSKDVQRIASRTGDAQGIESQVASSSEDADVTLEPDTISKICATNGLKEAAERFKVQWKRAGNTTWVSAHATTRPLAGLHHAASGGGQLSRRAAPKGRGRLEWSRATSTPLTPRRVQITFSSGGGTDGFPEGRQGGVWIRGVRAKCLRSTIASSSAPTLSSSRMRCYRGCARGGCGLFRHGEVSDRMAP